MADEDFPDDFELAEGVFYYCADCAEVFKPIVVKGKTFLFPDRCAYCAKPFNPKLFKDGLFRIPVENADLFVRVITTAQLPQFPSPIIAFSAQSIARFQHESECFLQQKMSCTLLRQQHGREHVDSILCSFESACARYFSHKPAIKTYKGRKCLQCKHYVKQVQPKTQNACSGSKC